MSRSDLIVIGGGIVGLATAWQILRKRPSTRLILLEKELRLAAHQSGRNSGVIHSGIYYRPGSLRAENCRAGKAALEGFCRQYSIPWKRTGKIIVATNREQLAPLQNIFERGQANGIDCKLIDRSRVLELEPHCAGIKAVHVPEAGIVDYPAVCRQLASLIEEGGGEIKLGTQVTGLKQELDRVSVSTNASEMRSTRVVNCTGLHSDRVARLSGQPFRERVLPFRGEYFVLKPEAESLCRALIYPVPDPRFPFLGVHFTRRIHGGVECGPNAVPALAREGYRWTTINLRDLSEFMTYPGALRMGLRYWKTGMGEIWRSFSKEAFVKALQQLVPDILAEHLEVAPSGVRAQALGLDGRLLDDFLILKHGRVLNVCNAPSPAATASLTIGQRIADELVSNW
jgi:L-2-hydroxyglutarate oxidase LhgO